MIIDVIIIITAKSDIKKKTITTTTTTEISLAPIFDLSGSGGKIGFQIENWGEGLKRNDHTTNGDFAKMTRTNLRANAKVARYLGDNKNN